MPSTPSSFVQVLWVQPALRQHRAADLRGKSSSGILNGMKEITFTIEPCLETGGFVARWDDAQGQGGITTQGDSFAELDAMIADAVGGYFEPDKRPHRVRLHFVEDPVVSLM
jgi:predicted RNase H-like HicB family nuclease